MSDGAGEFGQSGSWPAPIDGDNNDEEQLLIAYKHASN